ncbi:hypothetical protein AbraIFM66951_004942 [Aspergillus brasiliensis]|uniref:YCII-related domain-containing protein n=1 Tax=Aspergillus brasiliensis TaxID=319629 RepID=A0A9W5Z4I8_9EURO|nr:hypothetical protein AbraCBS73388_007149 [Aspergillus brasiliensis]GKZ43576.1 hypothetical protein AbraIFM66951_004942 [Aspergillus brasiliensis]
MPLFLLSVSYVAPSEQVEEYFAHHVEWLQKQYNTGAYIMFAKKVPSTGGVCLGIADSYKQMGEITFTDPFFVSKVAKYDIQEIDLTQVNTELLVGQARLK